MEACRDSTGSAGRTDDISVFGCSGPRLGSLDIDMSTYRRH
jgi:hypothetical protein